MTYMYLSRCRANGCVCINQQPRHKNRARVTSEINSRLSWAGYFSGFIIIILRGFDGDWVCLL